MTLQRAPKYANTEAAGECDFDRIGRPGAIEELAQVIPGNSANGASETSQNLLILANSTPDLATIFLQGAIQQSKPELTGAR